MVKEYFAFCEERFPEKKAELRRISLSLRREGILTMAALCQQQREAPEKIMQIRDIGGKSTQLIAMICKIYEEDS